MSAIKILIRISAVLWIICILSFIALLGISTNWFRGTVQDTSLGNSSLFLILFLGIIGLGILAFCVMVLLFAIKLLADKKSISIKKSPKRFVPYFFKLFFILAIFPIYLLYRILDIKNLISRIKSHEVKRLSLKSLNYKKLALRFMALVAVVLFLAPMWVGGYVVTGVLVKQGLGYNSEPITVSGTGSMYPTFPKGQGKTFQELSKEIVDTPGMLPYPNGLTIGGKRYFGYELTRGDIVVLINDKTKELSQKLYGNPSGWVKRIIGLPGDNIELRSGIVYLNSEPLKEPYTAKAQSTFGETYLSECKKVTVPSDAVFVMGDNRKGSGDSREIGFINIKDINHVLPIKSQKGTLDKNWRDTSKDLDESSKITLDKQKYVDLLNEKRKEAKVKPLKYQPKLETSALKRGEAILKYDDFSFEATRSGYTMAKAMSDSGYYNIVYGEAPQLGYYEAEELIENQFEFPETKKFLLNNDYQEIGITEVEGTLNGCPAQIIVQHFAGYVPPNYKKEDIESWRSAVNNLNSIIPSWEKAKGWNNMNQDDLKRLIDLLYRERTIATNILGKMEANQWLSGQEQNSIKEYDSLANESSALANKLNGR